MALLSSSTTEHSNIGHDAVGINDPAWCFGRFEKKKKKKAKSFDGLLFFDRASIRRDRALYS